MTCEEVGVREFFIYALIYSNKLVCLQLITFGLGKRFSQKSWARLLNILAKNLEKYMYMNSFLKPAILLKIDFFLVIFQGFCSNISEDFVHRTPPCIFLVAKDK